MASSQRSTPSVFAQSLFAEPWKQWSKNSRLIIPGGRKRTFQPQDSSAVIAEARTHKDAARIVACVNACAGISTSTIRHSGRAAINLGFQRLGVLPQKLQKPPMKARRRYDRPAA